MVPVEERVLENVADGLYGAGVLPERFRLGHLIRLLDIRRWSPGQDAQVWERFNLGRTGSVVFDGSMDSLITLGLGVIAQGEVHRSGFDPGEVDMIMGQDGLFDQVADMGISSHLDHYQWDLVLRGKFRGAVRPEVRGLVGFLGLRLSVVDAKLAKERVEVRVPNKWLESPTLGEMVLVLSEAPRQNITTAWVPKDEWDSR